MQTWFECKVKYLKIDQGGYERKVSDNYLIDAVSFTDAETRLFEQMHEITRGDFQVMNIKKSNISEVINKEDGEWWYKAKISLITIDEEGGKEKKVNNYLLIMADDLNQALKRLDDGLSYMLVPYVTTSITLSTIAEIFPYDLAKQSAALPKSANEIPVKDEYASDDLDVEDLDVEEFETEEPDLEEPETE